MPKAHQFCLRGKLAKDWNALGRVTLIVDAVLLCKCLLGIVNLILIPGIDYDWLEFLHYAKNAWKSECFEFMWGLGWLSLSKY